MQKPAQTPQQLIAGYLLTHGSIDQHTAMSRFRIYNLAAVVAQLRKRGHPIPKARRSSYGLKYTLPHIAAKYKRKNTSLTTQY